MRLGGGNDDDFIDRTGQSGGMPVLGGGGGMLGLLIPLVLSRFGLVGLLILGLGYCALGGLGGGGILGGGGSPSEQGGGSGSSNLSPEVARDLETALNNSDQVWSQLFASGGQRYAEPKLVAYRGGTATACGQGQASFGPFYCPGDQSIYIDPSFFNELSSRFGAPGDFARYYVIAHEVGHHIQNLEGTLDRASRAQASLGTAEGNAVQVGVELQADCYAGVWAALARNPEGGRALEPGDLEEGMRAAEAIGDDALQAGSGQAVRPESFTHGSSAQRMEALRRGLQSGDPRVCNYNRV
ncbi:neutral zinc metallopeptidase [Sphingomonas sp. LHG3406-1]|uniref:KPN_02809 family neutral zinc metallopeptidase n=1 Tax=Sphingomonas sp. LHG3406-1 TaxID=2804617 RepID=UPI00262126F1|nr:neutral zinc metallopeptidase [Sphingomonas sp. LHG3406-1]